MTALAAGWTGHDTRLIVATVLAIAVIVVLISKVKLHPLLALTLGSGVLGLVAGMPIDKLLKSFTNGVGSTIPFLTMAMSLQRSMMKTRPLPSRGDSMPIGSENVVSSSGKRTRLRSDGVTAKAGPAAKTARRPKNPASARIAASPRKSRLASSSTANVSFALQRRGIACVTLSPNARCDDRRRADDAGVRCEALDHPGPEKQARRR